VTQADKQTQLSEALDIYQAGLAMDGDKRAFDLLYRRWHPKLLKLAYRLMGNPDEARDVMQDAALVIARDIHKLRDPARFSAWAYTILRRRAADYIDRAVRNRKAQESKAATDQGPAAAGHDTEAAMTLRQALSQLPEADRLMLTLFYVDGLKGTEMAAALGVPIGTVKSRLFKARAKLKNIYETTEGDRT